MHAKSYILITISLFLSFASKAQDRSVVNWLSFEQLSDSLQNNPQKTLIFFHTDWCSYCKKMLKEAFRDEKIIEKLNKDYYAVNFDAESIDSITFDNVILKNNNTKKKRGEYHQIAKLLMPQKNIVFPTLLLLDENFNIIITKNKYLSTKELLNIL